MLQEIIVCSQNTAEDLEPKPGFGMISISGPSKIVNLKQGWNPILKLKFNDITQSFATFICFDWEIAGTLLDWLDTHLDEIETLVVHCEQGRSRSQAVAMFIQKYYAPHLKVPEGPYGTEGYNGKVYSIAEKAYLARYPQG